MHELRFEETDQIAGAMSIVYGYLTKTTYRVVDAAFSDIASATWGDGGIGQMSGFVDAP